MKDDYKALTQRIERLERAVFGGQGGAPKKPSSGKVRALPEIVKNKALGNGQQKIAAIVGYLENIQKVEAISTAAIKDGWSMAKFDGGFANILITRAAKEGLIADYKKNGNYVLTQTGETFWDGLTG